MAIPYSCGPSAGMYSGFCGDSLATSSERCTASFSEESDVSFVVVVPLFFPKKDVHIGNPKSKLKIRVYKVSR